MAPNLGRMAGAAAARAAASLPATAGKTTVPARTVSPPPPKPPRPAVPLDPVQQSLAPLYTQQASQSAAQNAAITNFTRAMISQLQGVPSQVQGDYNNAYNAQSALVGSAADALRTANPNQQDQQLLDAIGAPAAQHDQLANQNANVFNGGGAVGRYVNGVLPLGALQSQGLAATTLARLQPGFATLRGQQALAGALYQQGQDRAKIDALAPGLTQKYQAANVAAQQKQAYLDIARQSLGLKAQGQQFGQQLATTKLSVQQKQFIARQQQQTALFNARQTTTQAKLALPDATLSGKVGYLVDATGAPLNGKITPLPGYRIINSRIVKQGKSKATPSLTAYQRQKFKGEAATIAANAKTGFDGKDSVTGKPKHFDPLTRAQAWEEMKKHGVPETIALAALNREYTDPNPATNPNASGPPAP